MGTQHDTDLEIFTELVQGTDITPRCESGYCVNVLHKDSHEAEWIVVLTCGDDLYWCSERLALYQSRDYATGINCQKCHKGAWLTNMVPVTS